jgi:hypothetical protein
MNSWRLTGFQGSPLPDDVTANRTPSAWMISLFSLPTGKSCSQCGLLLVSANGLFLPSAEEKKLAAGVPGGTVMTDRTIHQTGKWIYSNSECRGKLGAAHQTAADSDIEQVGQDTICLVPTFTRHRQCKSVSP